MKILVIGKGGREHAIIRALKKSEKVEKIFCAPGNGGTNFDAINVEIDELNNEEIVNFSKANDIDFVVVSPDNPLANGLVDCLKKENIACFGPTKKAAQIESSKVFAKNLMKKYKIPTAKYEVFEEFDAALKYVEKNNKYPIVVKADGLAYGKGVVVAKNLEEAKNSLEEIIIKNKFKESGKRVVIEEFLEGTEVSVLCFTDGETIKQMPASMDHKAAYDDDEGPNTGGMGAITRNPIYTKEMGKICEEKIFIPTIKALNQENCSFSGCLYFGLMITKDGPKVIEYNSRFGDPEAQAILPLLETNLLEIMMAINEKKLKDLEIKFSKDYCACVVLAALGYPGNYEKNMKICGLSEIGQLNSGSAQIFHSGTKFENETFISNGGRILAVSCKSETLKGAIENAYKEAKKISIKNSYSRKDIGKKALSLIHIQKD